MCNRNKAKPDSFYSRIFASLYNPFMNSMEERILARWRKKILYTQKGNILEIGAGTGNNFQFYDSEAEVIACEPSKEMLRYAKFKINAEVITNVTLVHAAIGDDVLEDYVPEGGFDAIVFTLVLCTIPDIEDAIQKAKKWLHPDGKLLVLEHIHDRDSWKGTFQKVIQPLWFYIAEGCDLTRNTDQILKKNGFTPIWERYFYHVLPFYCACLRKQD
ncbi:class I SAM-dependent methyltransferase [Limibacter armeniacum]|uniref:class I SAM-dependent methyltransferase n=1 Tax=Limibacter armeniacum TaxID=466084 RepID=UPI002FE63BF0